MANMVMFCILAVVILGSAVLCVTTKRIMRAATFLLFVLFGVAGLYFLLDYTFLGAAQISVYAGGVTMLYVFSIQLVGKRSLQGLIERMKGSRVCYGALLSLVGLVTVVAVLLKSQFICAAAQVADVEVPMQQIGYALVGAGKYQYVLPFEVISVFLLACIIGGLAIARKEEK
jgi:NADH-quinone oxidoreductase subunit J